MLIYQTVRKASRPVHIIADLHEGFYCYRDEPLSTALSRRKKIDTKYLSPARPQGIGHLSPAERTPGKGRSCCCPEVQTRPHVSCGTESSGKMILSISPGAQQGGEARGNGNYTVVSWSLRLGGPVAEGASSLAHFAHLACLSSQAPFM